jgi:hypothetical protein
MQQTLTEVADLMSKMKPDQIPECWLSSETIDELLDLEIDEESF